MKSVELVCPTIRTVVVIGEMDFDENELEVPIHRIIPVLAFRTMIDDDGDLSHDVMAWDRSEDVISAIADMIYPDYQAYEVVVCPWTLDEDSARLKSVIDSMEFMAFRKNEKRKLAMK